MKSLSTGLDYDQVSLANDSGIFSLREHTLSWIPPPPSTTYGLESPSGHAQPAGTSEALAKLRRLTPNTKLGTLRCAYVVQSRVVGLYLSEESARFLLKLADGPKEKSDASRSEARSLINFVTQWNDLIVLTEADLASLEESWAGKSQPECEMSASHQDTVVYTLFEFATYIKPSWEIVREIIYVAISEAAFALLVRHAAYSKKHYGIQALPEIVRPCDSHVLNDAATCLRSGCPSQILLAAVTCQSFALYSLPER